MKLMITTAALALLATTAFADTIMPSGKSYPNGTSFAEFLAANDCTLVDMGGYSNARGPNGGGCTALIDWAPSGGGHFEDTDNDVNTPDEWVGSDY